MALMAVGASAQDWNAGNATSLPNGTKILDNDYVKINTAVQDSEAALIKDESDKEDPKTFGGFTFTKFINIRVDAAPAESNKWEGTAYNDATPKGISLIVTAKQNTDMTLYYKHGSGKVVSCYDQTAKENVAIVETAAEGVDNYYTGVYKFIKDHTYTIYATGGTTSLCGISTAVGTYVESTSKVYGYFEGKNSVTYGDGAVMTISGNAEKKYSKGGENIAVGDASYNSIKNSNKAQNTFTAATGKKIYRMTFYAVPNTDGADPAPTFTEFNGVTFSEPVTITNVKDGTKATQVIMCANGAESVTFTFSTAQVNFVVDVDYSESAYDKQYDPKADDQTAISTMKIASANAPAYNLAGQKVDSSFKGIIIKNGKKMIQK